MNLPSILCPASAYAACLFLLLQGAPAGTPDASGFRTRASITRQPAIAAVDPASRPATAPRLDKENLAFTIMNTFVVTNTNDTGSGSLRKAMLDANANAGLDLITFAIGGGGVHTIVPLSPLPEMYGPVIIDGTTQPGYVDKPLIEINGSLAGVSVNGITLYAGGSTVRGLAINGFIGTGPPNYFNGMGIYMDFSGGNKVEGCFIGTDASGLNPIANGGVGIGIFGASAGNIIGGTTAQQRNVLSGNLLHGIQISPGTTGRNVIQGNLIGVNAAGTAGLGNTQVGVAIFGSTFPDTIGGTVAGARNILSANGLEGVYIAPGVSGILIQGNYLGTDISGTARIGNVYEGIQLEGSRNIIGGTTFEARNVLSGNGNSGIYIYNTGATRNIIQGNYIGVSATGADTLGNTFGVVIDHSSNDTIGTPGTGGNVISGNSFAGVYIYHPTSTGNAVQANYIGTDITGNLDRGNRQYGVVLDSAANNVIGGTTAFSGNVISGNDSSGIYIAGATATGNKVQGNYIGTKTDGLSALPNARGVIIDNAPNNSVGGTTAAERNILSGNSLYGIETRQAGATGNSIRGNYIGVDATGTGALGNGSYGVLIASSRDTVGGTTAAASNIIAYNRGAGVYDTGGTGNLIRMNSIFTNYGGFGIDLAPRGLARNDSLDGDNGPNGLQNFPLLDSATVAGGTTTIHGRFNSKPQVTYTLDFYSNAVYDSSHFGEGETYLGSSAVTTNDSGNAAINVALPLAVPLNRYITATATDTGGNTSEFSQALCLSDSDADGIMDSWETQGWGIDVNSDSLIDADLYARGARPRHKDLFVEVDAMSGLAPADTTLRRDSVAFAAVPNSLINNPDGANGISLHIVISDTGITRTQWPTNWWQKFHKIKDSLFTTQADRTSPNARYIREAKKLVYRYCIFADTHDTDGSSGQAEDSFAQGCNDFMVTLGGWTVDGGTPDQKAGTFMHEFGHTLGLHHGGQDDINYKPNFISIMSYSWQTPFRWTNNWRLNYSTTALPTLYEANLNETVGLNPPVGAFSVIAVPFRDSTNSIHWARLRPATATDWTGNRDSTSLSVSVDINRLRGGATPGETLYSYVDWSKLIYNFRNSPGFADGPVINPHALVLEPEMTPTIFDELDNLPPPKPTGQFIMDGVRDTSSILLTSNAGIDLYARLSGTQLYVATNSAQSLGADMFIFVAVTPGSLQNAPWQKAGQVAGWSAFLANKSSDNSADWYDAGGNLLSSITVDSAGTVLEGVIDLELLTGASTTTVYLAVGKYQSGNGGSLLAQVPAGNGNANIDPNEFFLFNGLLPIQLASFTAAPLGSDRVRLDWRTLSETNNYGFEIQRKRNAEPEFQTLNNSFVPGHGTTIIPHSYAFTDSTASPGRWQYRLKQIDLDGTVHYTPSVTVDVLTDVDEHALPKEFALYQNYPNPFNPTTVVRYDIPAAVHVTLKVYNLLGQEVATLVNEQQQAGRYTVNWNASSVASGVYLYRIQAGSFGEVRKMAVIK